jgi:hypothetical protein
MTEPPRAAGTRIEYADVAAPLRAWVDERLGSPVVRASTQIGGFSPGSAARLVTADGRRAFIKAVSDEVNEQTPDLFRHERRVLESLPAVDYRAALHAAYDDGTWVALLLDDVDGHRPDLDDDAQYVALRSVIVDQTRELTPNPFDLDVPDMAATVSRWERTIDLAWDESPHAFPDWLHDRRAEVGERLTSLAERMPSETWVHLDVRDDNMLIRHRDGSGVLVDWGMSRPGPCWLDEVLLALHHVQTPRFDAEVARIEPVVPRTRTELETDVTDAVLSLAMSLAAIAERDVPGIPSMSAFRRAEATRLLAGVRRRLEP